MALCTLNKTTVVYATLVLPRAGVWHADVAVDTDSAITGPVTLSFGDGSLVYNGTVLRGDVFRGIYRARIVGGAAGLGRAIPPKYYRGAPLRLPLQDIIDACGEKLSASCDRDILALVLLKWSRRRGTAADALGSLVNEAGTIFRVLADGSIWVGNDSFTEVVFDHDLLSQDDGDGRIEIASELPRLSPGVTFLSKRISAVVHTIAPDRVRTTAWIERDTPQRTDRLKGALTAFVRNAVGDLDFLRPYPARVVLQEDDGTLHVQPDSDAIPGLTGVPIRYGIPGARAKVPPGARCILEFEEGNPTSPVVTAFEPGALVELSFADGTHAVSRVGDGVDTGSLSFAVDPTGSSLIVTYRPPGGAPQIVTLTFPTVSVAPGASSLDLHGTIAEGAPRVRA